MFPVGIRVAVVPSSIEDLICRQLPFPYAVKSRGGNGGVNGDIKDSPKPGTGSDTANRISPPTPQSQDAPAEERHSSSS